MTKSELVEALLRRQHHLSHRDIEFAVKSMLEIMCRALADGGRIEIRGFGSFSLRHRPARVGRNPKTGAAVALSAKHVPHFKPGKNLRARVNLGDTSEAAATEAAPAPRWQLERLAGFRARG